MGVRFCRENKDSVINKMRDGHIDAFSPSMTGLVDEIMLAMHNHGILKCLADIIPDKRKYNATVRFDLVLALSVAAKMKTHMSLTDIPFAITDHRVLAELGYNMVDFEEDKGFMNEGTLRALTTKYASLEFLNIYNKVVQDFIMPKLNLLAHIHILDCTILEVNLKNENYEGSAIAKNKDGKTSRGYKLATLRGIVGDTGIIEEARFGSMEIHDLTISKEMLYTSLMLKRGDILICDRGFLSREVINYLKTNRGVDVYVPLRCNMDAFNEAVRIAKAENKWSAHPNKKRKSQKIAFVPNVGDFWDGEQPENNVDLNACVVWDTEATEKDKQYFLALSNSSRIISNCSLLMLLG